MPHSIYSHCHQSPQHFRSKYKTRLELSVNVVIEIETLVLPPSQTLQSQIFKDGVKNIHAMTMMTHPGNDDPIFLNTYHMIST